MCTGCVCVYLHFVCVRNVCSYLHISVQIDRNSAAAKATLDAGTRTLTLCHPTTLVCSSVTLSSLGVSVTKTNAGVCADPFCSPHPTPHPFRPHMHIHIHACTPATHRHHRLLVPSPSSPVALHTLDVCLDLCLCVYLSVYDVYVCSR
jgi:hypothetical protein